MRKVILTKKNNTLIYDPFLQNRGLTLPANEFVELAVSYQNRFQKPISKRRLMWNIIEGKAFLDQPTTLTNSKGLGINRIKVKLDDPKASVTVRLLVWSLDEPDEQLEIECTFGATKAAPAVTDGNVLNVLFPWGAINPYTVSELDLQYSILYCDNTGEIIPGKLLEINCEEANIHSYTSLSNGYYYYHAGFHQLDYGSIYFSASYDGITKGNEVYVERVKQPRIYVENFWPPDKSNLKEGTTYTLKAVYLDANGHPVRQGKVTWDCKNYPNVTIEPKTSTTNDQGVATTTIRCTYDRNGFYNELTITASDNDAPLNGDLTFSVNTYFITRGLSFVNITPRPESGQLIFGQGISFSLNASDPSANVADSGVTWSVSGTDYLYFEPGFTQFNDNGQAYSTLKVADLPQGVKQDIEVTITGPNGVLWSGKYSIGSRVLKQITPTDAGPFRVGEPVPVTVQLFDPTGVTPHKDGYLYVGDNDYVLSRPNLMITKEDGTATFNATAKDVCSVALFVGEHEGPVPTQIPLTFGESNITINPPAPSEMQYDRKVSVKALYIGSDGKPAPQKTLKWSATNGVKFINDTVDTDDQGIATVEIYYETTAGYPGTGLITYLTATAKDGTTSGAQKLVFTRGSSINKLNVVDPQEDSQFPVGTYVTIVVQLVNDFGHPLTNYHIEWEHQYAGVEKQDADAYTDGSGKASITLKRTIEGGIIVTAVAPFARKHRDIRYGFFAQALPKYTMLYNRVFGRLNTKGSSSIGDAVFPEDEGQIVTFGCRYIKDGKAEAGHEVLWTYDAASVEVVPFYEDGTAIPDTIFTHPGQFTVPTNSNGVSVVHFVSYSNFYGQVTARPTEDPSIFPIATPMIFGDFGTMPASTELRPITVIDSTIDIPAKITPEDDSFSVRVPMYSSGDMENVVIWLRSGENLEEAQENIIITSVRKALSGVTIPYSYVYPTGDDLDHNVINYMATIDAAKDGVIAIPLRPMVKGIKKTHHPDYDPNLARPLSKPKLASVGNEITYNNIANGLKFKIPFSDKWVANYYIELNVYLNGWNSQGLAIGDTVIVSYQLTADDIRAQKEIELIVDHDSLVGYGNGKLEADYSLSDNSSRFWIWSEILEGIVINTLYPFS
ncbi:Ig-like domain-containing protein [Ochrobactrum soli]|uniref:Ig-like domain-containing protein n=1 Tax=Ochrobactrum soli TaxID=2448455 RepID=A0A849KCV4_9HYPH|nr:Ig-like domain-containing protein [[Ochrobactrum] soli]NNU59345.1 Ig-like domain-containing protein [[Ochrobactrum] soli]